MTDSAKRHESGPALSDAARLSQTLFVVLSLLLGLAAMGGAVVIAGSHYMRDPFKAVWQAAIAQEVLIAIGTSIVASVTFYVLYSRSAERRVLAEVATSASEAAADYAISLFQNRYERMLPTQVYPATHDSLPTFEEDFDALLMRSKNYCFKGDSGSITTFRLTTLCQEGRIGEKDIVLVILDPRRLDLLEERARSELDSERRSYSKAELDARKVEMQSDIFVTMVAIYDICHAVRTEVAFHDEHLFFRTEWLDGGLFLTYYIGGEFPGTYLYGPETYAYKAYAANFQLQRNAARSRIAFDSSMTEEDLLAHLREMGCERSVDSLREDKELRFGACRKRLWQ